MANEEWQMKNGNAYVRVAIVHDWLIGGGAELVVEQLHKLYPDAPIYTSYCSKQWRKRLNNKVITGYLQLWPFSKLRKFLPIIRSQWFKSLNFSEFDIVIVSSGNGEANHIQIPPKTKYIFYCHAPTHYLWDKYGQYIKNPGFGIFNPIVRVGLNTLLKTLKNRDYQSSQGADVILANSSHTKQQIKKYYQKDSVVVYPPVDVGKFKPKDSTSRSGFVILGRQVPYKRFDIAIKACKELGLPLTAIGTGPEHNTLKAIAGNSVQFIINATDQDVVHALQSAKGLVFPTEEDFGIAPVEALASGCPVIAYKKGGALDYVVTEKNGLFFEKQEVESLKKSLLKFNEIKFNENLVVSSAKKFSQNQFSTNLISVISKIKSNN